MNSKHKMIVPFSASGLDKLIHNFNYIQNNMKKLELMFTERSLEYIKERAITYLDYGTGGGIANPDSWYESTGYLKKHFIVDVGLKQLINDCYYAGFVEYGTGLYGINADGYVSNMSGKGGTGWGYYDQQAQGGYTFTHGQKPKRYMYNAVTDYRKGAYLTIFKQCVEELLNSVDG